MSETDFSRIASFLKAETGALFSPDWRAPLSGRLLKRVRLLKCASFKEYLDKIFGPEELPGERAYLLDACLTRRFEFMRERSSFDYLNEQWDELTDAFGSSLAIWCAAVSEGHEAYGLAISLFENSNDREFAIYGTDVNQRAIGRAEAGIYPHDAVNPLPLPARSKYFLRKKTPKVDLVRVAPKVRRFVTFGALNLLDDTYRMAVGFQFPLPVVFLRNTLPFLDPELHQSILLKVADRLSPGGLLFLGPTESLRGMDVPFEQAAPSVYRKLDA